MFSVLQLAEGEAVTGRLVLPVGEVRLHLGQPVAARCGALSGIDGLMELVLAGAPSFVLNTEEVAASPPLGHLGALLLEGCRLLDEWRRIEELVLMVDGGATPANGLAPLARHLDGRRTVDEAVRRAGVPRCRAVDPIVEGLDVAILVERARPVESVVTADDFDAMMEEGRKRVRAGQLVEAEAAFRRALAARPDDRIATQNLRRIAALTKG